MEKRICPYCGKELDKRSAMYTLILCNEEFELENRQDEFMERLHALESSSQEKKEARFEILWSHYGWNSDDMKVWENEFILSEAELREMIHAIKHPEEEVEEKPVRTASSLFSTSLENYGAALDLPKRQEPKKKKAGCKNYFYQEINMSDEFDYQGDISFGVKSNIIAKVRRVCHHCYNLTPDDLYELPMVKVYIMATPSSGKSSMLYSLYLNQSNFLKKNAHKMRWSYIQDMTLDLYFKKFYEDAESYQADKNTVSTAVKFIPPLLIRVDYTMDDEDATLVSLVLALFDNGGELFVENTGQNVQSLNQRVRDMDALVCILDGDNSALNQNKYSVHLSENDIAAVREKSVVLSAGSQEQMEQDMLMQNMTLEEIFASYGVNFLQALPTEQENQEQQINNLRNSGIAIVKNLSKYLGTQDAMREMMKQQHFSLVISKVDLLATSQMIDTRDIDLFFGKDDMLDYFSEEQRQRKLERDRKMREWQRKDMLLNYDLKNFREVNYHFVAAHIAKRNGIWPIRIEEPLIGIVEDFVRRKKD